MSGREEWAVLVERATHGDPCVSDDFRCLGCGIPGGRVADGAAKGCPVCIAFCVWAVEGDPDA